MNIPSALAVNDDRLKTEDYLNHFDTESYLSSYAFFQMIPSFDLLLKNMVSVFIQNKDRIGHGRALEFGGGPTLFSSFVLAQYVDAITFTDYTPGNLQAIENWINQQDDAHDWTEVFEEILTYYKEQSGDRTAQLSMWEKRLREVLGRGRCSLCGDVNSDNCPILDGQERYDIVLSSLCLEDACLTLDTYIKTIKRMTNLLNPGGFIYLMHGRNQTFYVVKRKRFFALPINEQIVREAFEQAGLIGINIISIPKLPDSHADADGFLIVYAYKTKAS